MKCIFTYTDDYGSRNCYGQECAMYDGIGKRCCFLTIAKVLSTYVLNTEK